MIADIMTTVEEFEAVKDNWNDIYLADDEATVFMSWPWMRGWIEGESGRWLVIGLRPQETSAYVAFMALNMTKMWNSRMFPVTTLQMAGRPLSDHTGFVCLPGYTEPCMAAFAKVVRERLGLWMKFQAYDVIDTRFELFLAGFHSSAYRIHSLPRTPTPFIALPKTWDEYVCNLSDRKQRYNVLSFLRRLETLPNYRVTEADEHNLESQIEVFLQVHKSRFGKQSDDKLRRWRFLFRRCFDNDLFWLPILWLDDRPLAGLVAFVDKKKGQFACYLSAFDPEFARLGPGRAMLVHSLRYAIKEGLDEYDFLRGNEPHKYSYGAVDRFNNNLVIHRTGLLAVADHFQERIGRGFTRLKEAHW